MIPEPLTSLCLLLLAMSIPGHAREKEYSWQEYKVRFGLSFSQEEDVQRQGIFKENHARIHRHNTENHHFKLGMNGFGHLTHAEFKAWVETGTTYRDHIFAPSGVPETPVTQSYADVDWRESGVVTPVKNQKSCGSSWAFSVVGTLEGQYAKKSGNLTDLSVQDLIDCSAAYGNKGCNGGIPDVAMMYIYENGVNTESEYAYKAKKGRCRHNSKTTPLKLDKLFYVSQNNEQELADIIAEKGPVGIGIDASDPAFQFYKSGIYSSSVCSKWRINHAMLVVGMGNIPQEHYIVKNSWGVSFGEEGYIRLARNRNNTCGVASAAYYVVLK